MATKLVERAEAAAPDAPVSTEGEIGAGNVVLTQFANFVVDNAGDLDDGDFSAGQLTLREAIRLANEAPDTAANITFDDALRDPLTGVAVINLSGAELAIMSDINIDGDLNSDGVPDVVVDAGGQSRVFRVESGVAALTGLTIANGYVGTRGRLQGQVGSIEAGSTPHS